MRVNFFAPSNTLGTGVHAMGLAKAFSRRGNQIVLVPPTTNFSYTDDEVSSWLKNRAQFSTKDPSLMIFDIPLFFNFCGSPKIGMAVFETDSFNDVQVAALRACDFLFTPSEWGREVLARNGFRNVTVVPEGYDPEIYKIIDEIDSKRPFTFIHAGKYEERKGTLDVISSFTEALLEKEATLLMHIHNPFIEDYMRVGHLLQNLNYINFDNGITWRNLGLKIEFLSPVTTASDMASIYSRADFGIFPTKGEGWGLPIMECMVSGVPVIAGAWSGQSEYLEKDYEFSLTKATSQIAHDGFWFLGDRGSWFIPDKNEIVSRIQEAHRTGRQFRCSESWTTRIEKIRRKFTWSEAARKLEAAIEIVSGLS